MISIFSLIYKQNLFVAFLFLLIMLVVYSILTANIKKQKAQLINGIIYLGFLFCIFYYTVYTRNIESYEIVLVPLSFLKEAQTQPEIYRSFFMNALLFVPIGLSMPFVLSTKQRKWPVFVTIGFASLLSVIIEFCQYYYHLGRCETDDVIANTLGAAVGTLSYCFYVKILKNREKGSLMQKNINNSQKLLLCLCAKSLFDKDITLTDGFDCKELVEESKRQTVFPCVYSSIKNMYDNIDGNLFSQIVAKNIRVEFAHNEVHRILSENNVSYVVLKGVASASYYKEPMLRMMGDVDVLVASESISKSDKLLKSIGFVTTDDIDGDNMHIGYKRKDGVACELHRRINGVPNNSAGDIVNKYLSDIFEKSIEFKTANGSCILPSKFHHCLILLLHTASHLTSEGVGLRHLCDWAVFVNSFTNDEFVNTFEKPLKDMGLWRFAQLLTLCCIKYLGCDAKDWAGETDEDLLEKIITDILNGGNFGVNDLERYSQIKYISDREIGAVAQKNAFVQLLCSINAKSKNEFPFVKKSVVFLPVGWLFTICKHLYLIIIGKRYIDGVSIITNAKKRKDIYDEFRLFKK